MNRTASLTHHETQSDAAYEAGHFDPLPTTLDTIAVIRKQNEAREALAVAETNLAIARREADTAWVTYDEVCELRALEMMTNEDVNYSEGKAKDLDLLYFEAYKQVDEIKAQLPALA